MIKKILLFWVIIFIGVFLRSYQADAFPINNNDDGIFYAWAGISFIQNPLRPISHSIFDEQNTNLVWRSQHLDLYPLERYGLKMVQPWFDHPPLAFFLIGIPSYLAGYSAGEQIPHLLVRLPALIASLFTLILTFLVAKTLFGEKRAYLSLLILAVTPYYVFSHRQAYIENFLTPMFLFSIYLALKKPTSSSAATAAAAAQTKLSLSTLGAVITASLCGWTKIIGFGASIILAGIYLQKKQTKSARTTIIAWIISLGSYLAYGLISDPAAFWWTLIHQGIRGAFPSSFFEAFTRISFYGDFNDGWYLIGMVASFTLIYLAIHLKKTDGDYQGLKYFSWILSGWLILLMLLSGRNNNSYWYRHPLIPFFAIATAYILEKLFKKPTLFTMLIFVIFGLTSFDLIQVELPSTFFRLALLIGLLPFACQLFWKNKIVEKLAHYSSRLLFAILIVLNILVVLKYRNLKCQQETCLSPMRIVVEQ